MRMVELLSEDERKYLMQCLTQESFRVYCESVIETLETAKRTFIDEKWKGRTDKEYDTLRAYDIHITIFAKALAEVRNMVEPK